MRTKLYVSATALLLVLTAPAFAQQAMKWTKPGADEVQLDWGKHGLDASHIGIGRAPNSTRLTSTDVNPVLGHTVLDPSGQSVGFITDVKLGTDGNPQTVFIKIGKEENAPIRPVSAQTISLGDGHIHTSMSNAQVEAAP